MIRSFACRETECLFNDQTARRLPPQIHRTARRKLLLLHQARSLQDLRVPYGNHLESLKGEREGRHSIRAVGPAGPFTATGQVACSRTELATEP